MRIFLIRHGESESDIQNLFGGDYDDHLTKRGTEQANVLAQKLKEKDIEIIFTSSRIRAEETAQIIQKTLNLELKIIEDLRERNNYGFLTGINKDQAKLKYPNEVRKLQDYHNAIKDAETYADFKQRIEKIWQTLTQSNYQSIAIVTHGGPIRCILREILKIGELKTLNDCAILEIKKENNLFQLISLENATLLQ